LKGRNWAILWRQDSFVIERYKWLSKGSAGFPKGSERARLYAAGAEALSGNDIDELRTVVSELYDLRIEPGGDLELTARPNIVRDCA